MLQNYWSEVYNHFGFDFDKEPFISGGTVKHWNARKVSFEENEEDYVIEYALLGYEKDDIDLGISSKELVISTKNTEHRLYTNVENLSFDIDKSYAKMKGGKLYVHLVKAEESKSIALKFK